MDWKYIGIRNQENTVVTFKGFSPLISLHFSSLGPSNRTYYLQQNTTMSETQPQNYLTYAEPENMTYQLQDTWMLKLPDKDFRAGIIIIYLPQWSEEKYICYEYKDCKFQLSNTK